MRVLHVFKTYLPDSFTGIERVIWQIAEGTKSLGVESEVFSLSKTDLSEPTVVGHHLAHTAKLDLYIASTGLSLSAFGKFSELARSADLIHYHFPWPMMDLLHFWARANKPSVLTYHSDIVRQRTLGKMYRPLMYRFLGSVDRIVATSPNYLASSPVLRDFSGKTSVIPIGLDEGSPVSSQLVEHWRSKVPERFFLFVGALRYYKGLQFLIEAAQRSGLPIVVGGSGDMEAALQAANLPNVQLVGQLSEGDKEALLSLATGFVFPSHLRSEAFGVALLEAARAGRAMISCEMGTGTSYVNLNEQTGLTVPPADASALAEAMSRLWQAPGKTRAMGQAARARYLEHFTADAQSARYKAIYDDVLKEWAAR